MPTSPTQRRCSSRSTRSHLPAPRAPRARRRSARCASTTANSARRSCFARRSRSASRCLSSSQTTSSKLRSGRGRCVRRLPSSAVRRADQPAALPPPTLPLTHTFVPPPPPDQQAPLSRLCCTRAPICSRATTRGSCASSATTATTTARSAPSERGSRRWGLRLHPYAASIRTDAPHPRPADSTC